VPPENDSPSRMSFEAWHAADAGAAATRRDALAAVVGAFGLGALGPAAFGQTTDEARFRAFQADDLKTAADARGNAYYPFLTKSSVALGLYRLSAGADDRQQPHDEDEVYVVLEGQATFDVGGRRTPVKPGTVLYVPARAPHRFVDIEKDLAIIVLFSKARPAGA